MVANLMLTGRVECEFDVMWKFLNKSISLGSAAGLNTLGLCYKKGINPDKKVDLDKAKELFIESSEFGYVFAFNNIGKLYEEDGSMSEAIKYYNISADMGNSWALNKLGEYYRKKGDLDKAYLYYSKATEAPISERCIDAVNNIKKYYNKNEH